MKQRNNMKKEKEDSIASVTESIKKFAKEAKYGQVTVYIQNSQITQIELLKKLKLNKKIEDNKN